MASTVVNVITETVKAEAIDAKSQIYNIGVSLISTTS